MVAWALLIRLVYIVAAHTYRFPKGDWHFGWETGRIARSLALGQGFANPMKWETGPSAWVAPVYPTIMAGVFRVFGVYTEASAFVMLAMNAVFSALTAVPLYLIARKCFGNRTALWTGWLWVVLPPTMMWSVRWIWETSLSTLLLMTALWLALEIEEHATTRRWIAFGAVWGLLALTNPSTVSILPFAGGWTAWRLARAQRPWFTGAVVSALMFFAVLAPWTLRNYSTFGEWMFVRGNFGVELRLGLGDEADGTWQQHLHPSQNLDEFARFRELGERAYVKARATEAKAWIADHPRRYAELIGLKALYFWAGTPKRDVPTATALSRNALYMLSSVLAFGGLVLCWKRGVNGAFLFTAALLVYPLAYYLTFPHPRYRHPIEPVMLMLMVFAFGQVAARRRAPAKNLA